MPQCTYVEHSKLSCSIVWCIPHFICWFCNQVSRGQWWNQNGDSRWHCWIRKLTLIIFCTDESTACQSRTMYLCICIFWGQRIEMLHERLSEAGENVFILRERTSELISSDRDLEMANFHRNVDELSTLLTRLRVYFENMADYLNEDTVNVPAHQSKREYTGMRD